MHLFREDSTGHIGETPSCLTIHLGAALSPATAEQIDGSARAIWRLRRRGVPIPTFSQWKRAATGTGELEVAGYVNGDWMEVRSWRPAQRDPLLQPTLTGRVVATDNGCLFTGAIETRMPVAPVLVAFFSIVGLALMAGAVGVVTDALHGHRAAALHWLPLLVVPAVMVGFAFIIIAISRAQARGRERFLREWLIRRLA